MSLNDKVRYGIIGAGNMGTAHLSFFMGGGIENAVVMAVADINPDKLKSVRDAGFAGECYNSGEELIDNADIDAVIVATPHYSHPPLCIRALNKGINTICEKPAGVYTKQVEMMNEAAKKSSALFTMMFNQRTNCVFRKMRELIAAGELGQIKRINWLITNWYRSQSYYDSGSWRATWAGEGGGVLFNQCPHQLDLLQWVTGMMPARIRAFCHFGKWHDIEVEDDVTAYLEYGNGATGVFITSTADAPGTNRFEVLGTKGKIVCEADEGKLSFWRNETDEREFNATWTKGFGEPNRVKVEIETDGQNPQHKGILNNFTRAVRKEEPLYVDGTEGIRGVELMDAMLLSAWLDKFVELPLDGDLYVEELDKRIKNSKKKNSGGRVLDTSGSYNEGAGGKG